MAMRAFRPPPNDVHSFAYLSLPRFQLFRVSITSEHLSFPRVHQFRVVSHSALTFRVAFTDSCTCLVQNCDVMGDPFLFRSRQLHVDVWEAVPSGAGAPGKSHARTTVNHAVILMAFGEMTAALTNSLIAFWRAMPTNGGGEAPADAVAAGTVAAQPTLGFGHEFVVDKLENVLFYALTSPSVANIRACVKGMLLAKGHRSGDPAPPAGGSNEWASTLARINAWSASGSSHDVATTVAAFLPHFASIRGGIAHGRLLDGHQAKTKAKAFINSARETVTSFRMNMRLPAYDATQIIDPIA